jgi:drug/metabolite transporter (DMT)-like permease
VSESATNGKIDMVATAASLGTLCGWSLGPIFIEYLTGYVDSWTQNALRYSVASLFWLPLLFYFHRTGRFDRRTWRLALVPAAANLTMQSIWAQAFYYIEPGFLVLLSKTSVLWVAGFSLRFWIGLSLSLAGVFGVLYFKEDFSATGTIVGIVIALVTGFAWAVYALSVRIALREIDSRCGFGIVSLYTTVGLWVGALAFGDVQPVAHMGARPWAAVVFSVVFRERLNLLQLLFGVVLLAGAALSVWTQQHLRTQPQTGTQRLKSA